MPPPPPPALNVTGETEGLIVSPDLTRFDLEYAVWVHGGYPQIPWTEAVRELMRKCKTTAVGCVSAAAFWELDNRLNAATDLTNDRAENYDQRFGESRRRAQ